MKTFIQRIFRAARLDVHLYEEVEADKGILNQAILVVVLSSIAAGIGAGGTSGFGLILGALFALIGWFLWAYLTYFFGVKLFPEPQTEADHGQLLRTLGFSSAPGLIRVLGVIAPIRGAIFLIASIWMLVAMVIAVRQALDYKSTLRAIGVCCVGWIVQLLALAILFGLLMKGPAA